MRETSNRKFGLGLDSEVASSVAVREVRLFFFFSFFLVDFGFFGLVKSIHNIQ